MNWATCSSARPAGPCCSICSPSYEHTSVMAVVCRSEWGWVDLLRSEGCSRDAMSCAGGSATRNASAARLGGSRTAAGPAHRCRARRTAAAAVVRWWPRSDTLGPCCPCRAAALAPARPGGHLSPEGPISWTRVPVLNGCISRSAKFASQAQFPKTLFRSVVNTRRVTSLKPHTAQLVHRDAGLRLPETYTGRLGVGRSQGLKAERGPLGIALFQLKNPCESPSESLDKARACCCPSGCSPKQGLMAKALQT